MAAPPRVAAPLRLFDAHCHAADARLAHVAHAALRDARAAGVAHCVVCGTCEDDWPAVAALAAAAPARSVVASFGVHPWRAHAAAPGWEARLEALLLAHPRAAVGECGLHAGGGAVADAGTQAACLRAQLALAARLRRPAALHCVRAHGQLHDILRAKPAGEPAYVLLHSYSGSAEMVPRFAALGAHFSFSATLASMAPQRAAAVLRAVPDDRILLETDAPDGLPRAGAALQLQHVPPAPPAPSAPAVAPPAASALALDAAVCGCGAEEEDGDGSARCQPQRRRGAERAAERAAAPLNHPANLRVVLTLVAQLRGTPEAELVRLAWDNARRFYRICLDEDDAP